MKPDFWLQRWETNELGFHQDKPNGLMRARFGDLELEKGAHVFVPLCGKSLDIGWLLGQGYRVSGAELSEIAIAELFETLGVSPDIAEEGPFRVYRGPDITVFVGDFFELTGDALGSVEAVYDRAALIAMPDEMRGRYADHLAAITARAPQFLLTVEYDQREMNGPPFSVTEEMVRNLYEDTYDCRILTSRDVKGGLKGKCKADEVAWHLIAR